MVLSQARLLQLIHYDPETGEFRWRTPTSACVTIGQLIIQNKKSRYLRIQIDGKRYYAHKLAWLYVYGELPRHKLDHRDCNSFNNRIKNLRRATQAQNCKNRSVSRNNKSGTSGVYWHNRSSRWRAILHCDNKRIWIGAFRSKEEAIEAIKEARLKYHGEFAKVV
jgi:hypothetical protein